MNCKAFFGEIISLLYWSMLGACTVGPGTVVTCARAGSEYQLHLIWALIIGSFVAFTLQEGTARLTVVSGRSLGQCLQIKYQHHRKIWEVSWICWLVAGSIFFGNILFECNNWAGGMSAIYSLPDVDNITTLRVSCCIGYGIIVAVILFIDKVNAIGIGLGFVMVGMTILFTVVVIKLGLDAERFGKGLLPISMPSGSTNIVLSLVGTTSIGFNLFLGGSMAKGRELRASQRGIAFSTLMAFIVSVLILIVGDGTSAEKQTIFTIASLALLITQLTGTTGIWIFSLGFIAAALSSMLTVILGAVLAAQSVFTIDTTNERVNCNSKEDSTLMDSTTQSRVFPKKYERVMIATMIVIPVIVISANAPTVTVILIAQVFNGCLLPFFSTCLLFCINDPQFMEKSPQGVFANICLLLVVMVTLFLTANTIIQNFFGWLAAEQNKQPFELVKLTLSSTIAVISLPVMLFCTKDGKNIQASFKKKSLNNESFPALVESK